MLRVAPDGKTVWVQTAGQDTNVVLDVTTMDVLNTAPAGHDPNQSAIQPGGRHSLIAHGASNALTVLDSATGAPVRNIDLGKDQANITYTPDRATAFVSSPSGNEVVVVDMNRLAVVGRIPTGRSPMGLVLLGPHRP